MLLALLLVLGLSFVPSEFQRHFDRDEGWLGADGAYSAPLPDGSVLWLFSDTLAGRLDEERALAPGWKMLHNSWGLQKNARAPLELHAQELFPGRDETSWYWVYAALARGTELQVFLGSFETDPDGPPGLNFRQNGTALATLDLRQMKVRSLVEVPHFRSRPAPLQWGAALLEQDGWVYVYGTRDLALRKELVVARTRDLGDFAGWRFWDGSNWGEDPDRAAVLLPEAANELSVVPWQGEVLAVAQVGAEIRAHTAPHPWGPFAAGQILWTVREEEPGVFTYNAKLHPELGMLLTYNRNVLPLQKLERKPWLYRPQCLGLPSVKFP